MIEAISKVAKTGDVYGRYTVLGIYRDPALKKRTLAHVQCSCGTPPRYVRIDNLRDGTSQSCGCARIEAVKKHGLWNDPLFKVWKAMLSRCTNPKDKRFSRYGGRGISVCERWINVHNFIEDMKPAYAKGMTLDREDNNGNYEPNNCRWATRKEQNRNYSRNVILEHDGKRFCAADWAPLVNIPAPVIYDRIARGWSATRTLTTPVKS